MKMIEPGEIFSFVTRSGLAKLGHFDDRNIESGPAPVPRLPAGRTGFAKCLWAKAGLGRSWLDLRLRRSRRCFQGDLNRLSSLREANGVKWCRISEDICCLDDLEMNTNESRTQLEGSHLYIWVWRNPRLLSDDQSVLFECSSGHSPAEVQYCGSKKIIYSRVTVNCILPTSGLTEYLAATWLTLQTQIVKSLNCLQWLAL